jgi:hypothetical protein
MKLMKTAAVAAFLLACAARVSAEAPTWSAQYELWFINTTGRYEVEYFVDAYDNDGDLYFIHGDGYDEIQDLWWPKSEVRGDNWHLFMRGWAVSRDAYTLARYWVGDRQQTLFWQGEVPDWYY